MLAERERQFAVDEIFIIRSATMNDVENAVTLFNACSEAMIGRPEANVTEIRTDWQTPGFDLEASTRVVLTPTKHLVGYVEVWDVSAVPVNPWIWLRVHPEFEGQGIGEYLLTWAEERARQAIDRVPEGARVAVRAGAVSTYRPAKRLYEEFGMEVVRNFWDMLIELNGDIPAPKWPKGIELRTYEDVNDLEAVYQAIDEAFADHWGHVEQSPEEGIERWRHWTENDEEFDPSLWFLAVDGDQIAGVCLCRRRTNEDPDMGHVNVLGVRRPWRRQGLALALLHHAFAELGRRGRQRVNLGVDAASLTGATRLYTKAGMHVHRQYDNYEKVLRPGKDLATRTLASS